MLVPKPPIEEQIQKVNRLESFYSNIKSASEEMQSAKRLHKSLINQIF